MEIMERHKKRKHKAMSIDNRKLSNHGNNFFGLVRSTRPGVVAWLRRLESAHARPGGSSLDADCARGCQIGGLLSFLFGVVCDPTWDSLGSRSPSDFSFVCH